MSRIDVDQVLGQMRALAAQSQGRTAKLETDNGDGPGFAQLLKNSVNKVNDLQHTAGALAKSFETGQDGVDLAEVMVALQKSSVSFQAMVQVRNKLVDAYKDVMNMPV